MTDFVTINVVMKDEIKLEAVETSDLKVEYAQHQAEIRVNEMLSQEGGGQGEV